MHVSELKKEDVVSVQLGRGPAFKAKIIALFPQFAKVKDIVTGMIRSVAYGDIKEKVSAPSTLSEKPKA